MRRGLWFAVGAGAGVYATTRVRRFAESLTVEGLRHRVNGLSHGARLFGEELRSAQQEKESELRERLGLTPGGPAALPGRTDPAQRGTSAPGLAPPTRLHSAESGQTNTQTGKTH